MTQVLDTKRKVLIGVSATMFIGAAVAAVYSTMPPAPAVQPVLSLEEAPHTQVPNLLPESPATAETAILITTDHEGITQPPTAVLNTSLPKSAQTILSLSEQIQLNELRAAADKAALQAKEAQAALTGNAPSAHLLNTQLGLDTAGPESSQPKNMLEQIQVRSLASTPGGMTGWVALGNELIPIQQGTQIGDVSVVRLTEQYVVFLYKGQHARKYAGS